MGQVKIFKGCLPQILLGLFLNTSTQIIFTNAILFSTDFKSIFPFGISLFKFNNGNTRPMCDQINSAVLVFSLLTLIDFAHCSVVSTVYFEQENADCVIICIIKQSIVINVLNPSIYAFTTQTTLTRYCNFKYITCRSIHEIFYISIF